MDTITIENISKCYRISASDAEDAPGFSPREFLRGLRRRKNSEEPPSENKRVKELWALRNISLKVQPGILGVIGPNGAGKSTLLKVIARVTAPTEGRIVGSGRVVSLLDMGAGFNPDLSARDNVFMQAALNGFTHAQAQARFDEIIKFAEMEEFVNSPLKFYSSGMYLRLAFSVAINMQPRILLADEILAVGDVAFQARCMQRIEEMGHGKEALTILFVSHDMDAIMRVCDRVIWIEEGRLVKDGDPEEVVTEYQNTAWSRLDATTSGKGRTANRWAEIMSVRVLSADGKEVGAPALEEPCRMRIRFRTNRGRLSVRCAVDVRARGQLLFRSVDQDFRELPVGGVYDAILTVPEEFLAEINYTVGVTLVILRDGKEYVLTNHKALAFMVYSSDVNKVGVKVEKKALIAPQFEWSVQKADHVR